MVYTLRPSYLAYTTNQVIRVKQTASDGDKLSLYSKFRMPYYAHIRFDHACKIHFISY